MKRLLTIGILLLLGAVGTWAAPQPYTIQLGDTLGRIAKNHG